MKPTWVRIVLGACAMFIMGAVGATDLVLGQVAAMNSSDLDGPGYYLRIGIKAYLDAVNDAGGVHGASIRLVSKDRGLQSNDAVTKTKELLREARPILLIGLPGTGPMEALVKSGILEDEDISVLGIRTGAQPFHEPVNPHLFHTRANYLSELQKIMLQLDTVGLNKIATFAENSSFGREGEALVRRTLPDRPRMVLVERATYEQQTNGKAVPIDVTRAVDSVLAAHPQAVISIATSSATAEFYKLLRQRGGKMQVVAISVTDAGQVVRRIGHEAARGLIVTEVVPDPNNATIPLIRELRSNLARFGSQKVAINSTIVEGYIAAKTAVEALRRAGPQPTRRSVRAALEGMTNYDTGGVVISFSSKNHTGSKHVDIGMVVSKGMVMR